MILSLRKARRLPYASLLTLTLCLPFASSMAVGPEKSVDDQEGGPPPAVTVTISEGSYEEVGAEAGARGGGLDICLPRGNAEEDGEQAEEKRALGKAEEDVIIDAEESLLLLNPHEILLSIASFLDCPSDYLALSRTSVTLHRLLLDPLSVLALIKRCQPEFPWFNIGGCDLPQSEDWNGVPPGAITDWHEGLTPLALVAGLSKFIDTDEKGERVVHSLPAHFIEPIHEIRPPYKAVAMALFHDSLFNHDPNENIYRCVFMSLLRAIPSKRVIALGSNAGQLITQEMSSQQRHKIFLSLGRVKHENMAVEVQKLLQNKDLLKEFEKCCQISSPLILWDFASSCVKDFNKKELE